MWIFDRPPRYVFDKNKRAEARVVLRVDSCLMLDTDTMDTMDTILSESIADMEERLKILFGSELMVVEHPFHSESVKNGMIIIHGVDLREMKGRKNDVEKRR